MKSTYEELQAQVELLRLAALNAIQAMSGGEAKAGLRDAYDATPSTCLAQVKAEAHKAGFIMGCEYAGDGLCNEVDLQQYAERIRQGVV